MCMSVKVSVFHLKVKTKGVVYLFFGCCYVCYRVNKSLSGFKDLVSKTF